MKSAPAVVRELTHRRGANFSLGFRLLPPAKRRAVYAAYAACRIPDDIVDEAGPGCDVATVERRLDRWRDEIEATFSGRPGTAATRALAAALARFPLPKDAFLGLVEGCRMDLLRHRYETFADLERYCELVAVTISDISLAIFGRCGAEAGSLGRHLALALQLTNICRDVGEDAGRDRLYLPMDEAARFGVTAEEVLTGRVESGRYRDLLAFQCQRAADHFAVARALPRTLERDSRVAVRIMAGVYRRVLASVARDPVRAYGRRVELTRGERLAAVLAGVVGA